MTDAVDEIEQEEQRDDLEPADRRRHAVGEREQHDHAVVQEEREKDRRDRRQRDRHDRKADLADQSFGAEHRGDRADGRLREEREEHDSREQHDAVVAARRRRVGTTSVKTKYSTPNIASGLTSCQA